MLSNCPRQIASGLANVLNDLISNKGLKFVSKPFIQVSLLQLYLPRDSNLLVYEVIRNSKI